MIEIKQIFNLYDEDEKGKKKLIKKNIILKRQVNINDISNPSQIIGTKGAVVKKKCKIYVKDVGELIINHSYEYISDLINNKGKNRQQIGFKIKNDNR